MSDGNRLFRATLDLYADALRQSSVALLRHIWIVGLVPAYSTLLHLIGGIAATLGFAGGFLVYLAVAACASSFLAVIGESVAHQRVRLSGIGQTFGLYFGRLITVLFMFWIIRLLLGMTVSQNQELLWLVIAINASLFLVFNPLPEVIYQGSSDGMALLQETFQFTRENLLEWFVPLAVVLSPFFLIDTQTGFLVMAKLDFQNGLGLVSGALANWIPLGEPARNLAATLLASLLIVWIMLFRGFLFRSLAQHGRRQRLFASRARGR